MSEATPLPAELSGRLPPQFIEAMDIVKATGKTCKDPTCTCSAGRQSGVFILGMLGAQGDVFHTIKAMTGGPAPSIIRGDEGTRGRVRFEMFFALLSYDGSGDSESIQRAAELADELVGWASKTQHGDGKTVLDCLLSGIAAPRRQAVRQHGKGKVWN